MTLWIINAVAAGVAALVNLVLAATTSRWVRVSRLVTGLIAATYCVGITWGLATDNLDVWAKSGRILGPVAWIAVWIAPPIISTWERQRSVTAVVARIDDLGRTVER